MLSESRGLKFVTTLVLVFKKIEREDKTKYDTFYLNSQKHLSKKVILMMYLNQCILQLCQAYKNLYEKVQTGLLIQSLIIILAVQSTIL